MTSSETQTSRSADPRLSQGRWLRIPGPTVVHPAAVAAQAKDMIPHRGPEMSSFMADLRAKARTAHRTEGQVLMWAASGSAGWEASIVNFLSPGDTVVATVCGSFGERWASLGTAYGLDVHRVEVPWGNGISPDTFAEVLEAAGEVKAVFITHNETSTGVTNPLQALARLARDAGAMVFVDAVSSAGALPLEVDAWDLDWVFSGVQKAWMCPPGIMMATVSERAMAASAGTGYNRFYFDVRTMAKAADEGSTATTPAISLLYALDASLDEMLAEGIEQVWARHQRLGRHVREGLGQLGLRLVAESGYESDSITGFWTPDGLEAVTLKERVSDATGIVIATAQGAMAKTAMRIGHMGWVETPELDATLEALAANMT